jgi:hypothetical protein
MRRLLLLFLLFNFRAYGSDDITCLNDGKGWNDWKDDAVKVVQQMDFSWIKPEAYASFKSKFDFLQKCKSDVSGWMRAHPVEASCTNNIDQYYSAALAHLKPVSDSDPNHFVLAQTTLADVNSPIQLAAGESYSQKVNANLPYPAWVDSEEFKKALDEVGFSSLKKLIDDKNLTVTDPNQKVRYVRFKGFSFGAADDSPQDRFMAYLPGYPERILLAHQSQAWHAGDTAEPGTLPCTSSPCSSEIAMLGIFADADKTSFLIREAPTSGDPRPQLNSRSFNPGDCFSCHASGAIAIHGPVVSEDQSAASFINERIRTSFNGEGVLFNRFSELGPSYGDISDDALKRRTPDFIQSCSGGTVTDPNRARKIASAMTCAKCHDNDTRGTLTERNSLLMQRYVMSGLMPPHSGAGPDSSFTRVERKALYDCLKVEFPANLAAWLKRTDCRGTSGQADHLKKLQKGGIGRLPASLFRRKPNYVP